MTINIIGLGLIGGSLGLALRKTGQVTRLIGSDKNPQHAARALELGLVDEIMEAEQAVQASDLIATCVPVNSLSKLLPQLLNQINENQIVIDVGSTKGPVTDAIAGHPMRSRFVPTHPMAGTEYSGPDAAIDGLFEGKGCVFCDTQDSAPDALETVQQLFRAMGMRLTEMESHNHDLHVAYVSHISHIASFALALTVLEKEKAEDRIFELAGGGFSSTVRLAKSSPDTWIPIFEQNRDNVLDVLDEFINTVSRFRTLLIKRDFETFSELIGKANDIRRIIK